MKITIFLNFYDFLVYLSTFIQSYALFSVDKCEFSYKFEFTNFIITYLSLKYMLFIKNTF